MSKKCSLYISELSESDYISVPPQMPQMDKFACCLAISCLEEGERPSHTFQGLGGEPQLTHEAQEEGNRPWQGEGHENRPGQGTHIKPPPLWGHIYTYDINIYS